MSQEDPEVVENTEKSFFGIIVHSFFIIPFLIAVFCILLFTAVNLLTQEKRSAYDYLEDVKTGGLTKRWQGAFELSKILSNQKLLPEENKFYQELITTYQKSGEDDPRVRQYLALAMGRTGKRVFVEPLIESLGDANEQDLAAVIFGLGLLQDPRAIPSLTELTTDSRPRVRSLAVVALGNIGTNQVVKVLRASLDDTEPNVQWGAAISLARVGDNSGEEIINSLLNRNYYTSYSEIDPDEINNLMLAALEVSQNIKSPNLNEAIKELSLSDPNMNIRSKALKILNP